MIAAACCRSKKPGVAGYTEYDTPVTVDVQCVWDPDPAVAGSDSITFQ